MGSFANRVVNVQHDLGVEDGVGDATGATGAVDFSCAGESDGRDESGEFPAASNASPVFQLCYPNSVSDSPPDGSAVNGRADHAVNALDAMVPSSRQAVMLSSVRVRAGAPPSI